MTDAPPTLRQIEVLRNIQASRERRGYSPTLRELCEELGIRSLNGINDHLKALERKGLVTRSRTTARSLIPTGSGLRILEAASLFSPPSEKQPSPPHGEFSPAPTEPISRSAPEDDATEHSSTHRVNGDEKGEGRCST